MAREKSNLLVKLLTRDVVFKEPVPSQSAAECIKSFEQLRPAAGRKSEAWLVCRTAERRILAEFWGQMRLSFRQELASANMEQAELDGVISVISVSSSIEYATIVEHERLQVSQAVTAAALNKNTAGSTSEREFWVSNPDVSALIIDERAAKPKTRPLQLVSSNTNQTAPLEPCTDTDVEFANQLQIPASNRALEVIRKMYPTSVEEILAKDTDWDLFVHAMKDLDFNARNVGGSGVAFEHPSKKKIIFHRPHPVAKIDSVMLQSMGKRLTKHFDWSRETFVEL